MTILAIDPGPMRSAFAVIDPRDVPHGPDGYRFVAGTILPNEKLLDQLRHISAEVSTLVIEKVEGFGMAVGAEVFETVYWSGQFAEAAHPTPVERIGRKAIKIHLCGTVRAKDTNIRQALIDRYGGATAKGTKRAPGPLYGVAGDLWSALAVALTYADRSVPRLAVLP